MTTPQLSIVIPVYQAEACVLALYSRLTEALEKITAHYEIILVDDCSRDDSWTLIRQVALSDRRVKALHFSRNFGQHYAITAGLSVSQGAWAIVMDCDLQDPPEEIEKLYWRAQEGYDVVYARRRNRKDHPLKVIPAKIYNLFINTYCKNKVDGASGSFTCISRKVIDAFLQVRDYHRHYLIILRWLGFKHTFVDVEHAPRYAGKSAYSLSKLIALAIDGIITQTDQLLRFSMQIGFLSSLAAIALLMYVLYQKLVIGSALEGWSSIMSAILFLGGMILMSIGVLGIYIEKIFIQTKHRPLFIVDQTVNLASSQDRKEVLV